jgi:hypothetical protein
MFLRLMMYEVKSIGRDLHMLVISGVPDWSWD